MAREEDSSCATVWGGLNGNERQSLAMDNDEVTQYKRYLHILSISTHFIQSKVRMMSSGRSYICLGCSMLYEIQVKVGQQ